MSGGGWWWRWEEEEEVGVLKLTWSDVRKEGRRASSVRSLNFGRCRRCLSQAGSAGQASPFSRRNAFCQQKYMLLLIGSTRLASHVAAAFWIHSIHLASRLVCQVKEVVKGRSEAGD